MGFVEKDWRNATTHAGGGDESTPISAVALEDLETRVTDYADLAGGNIVNVEAPPYNAVGDLVADDTAAIQAAIDANPGRPVYLPGTYRTTGSLELQLGSQLIGPHVPGAEALETAPDYAPGTVVNESADPAIVFPTDDAGAGQVSGNRLEGLQVVSTGDGIAAPNGAVGGTQLVNLTVFPADKGIHLQGFTQDWYSRNVDILGGNYGVYYDLSETGVTNGTNAQHDACRWDYLYCHGQAEEGTHFRLIGGTGVVFTLLRLVNIAKNGMRLGGYCYSWVFNGLVCEGIGWVGPGNHLDPTTISANSGDGFGTVADATGIGIGNTLTIHRALYGMNSQHTVTNVVGTTVSFDPVVASTVVDAVCTTALYCDVAIPTDQPTVPTFLTFNSYSGGDESFSNLRYGMDLSGAAYVTLNSPDAGQRGIYDPTGAATAISGNPGGPYDTFNGVTLPSQAQMLLPPGDIINITGTTNISNINVALRGRKVTLKFADVLTVSDASNLKLAGDFTTSAGDTLTLISDGSNWYEVARSVN